MTSSLIFLCVLDPLLLFNLMPSSKHDLLDLFKHAFRMEVPPCCKITRIRQYISSSIGVDHPGHPDSYIAPAYLRQSSDNGEITLRVPNTVGGTSQSVVKYCFWIRRRCRPNPAPPKITRSTSRRLQRKIFYHRHSFRRLPHASLPPTRRAAPGPITSLGKNSGLAKKGRLRAPWTNSTGCPQDQRRTEAFKL